MASFYLSAPEAAAPVAQLISLSEIWELTKSASFLKVGAVFVNLAVVVYLLWRLRRATPPP
jgi:uncharacterized membrane protein (DUF2068 family)